jgi:hypothetical protein
MGNALHDLETRTDFESLSQLVVATSVVGTVGNGSPPLLDAEKAVGGNRRRLGAKENRFGGRPAQRN